jgi:hypothetical protein
MFRSKRTKPADLPRTSVVLPDVVLAAPDHLFNRPGLKAIDFLVAVMRDPNTPISCRVQVAGILLQLFPDDDFMSPLPPWPNGRDSPDPRPIITYRIPPLNGRVQ